MIDPADRRGELIKHLEDAMTIADELEDDLTGYMIERALDEARAQYFSESPGTRSRGHDASASSRALASLRSRVSKPSVNQPYTGARAFLAHVDT
jgi:hypothetical protein